jgi:hypothetical protein
MRKHLRGLARLRRVRGRIEGDYAPPLDLEALARGAHMPVTNRSGMEKRRSPSRS